MDERVGKLQAHFGQAVEDMRKVRVSTEKVIKCADGIERVELGDAPPADELPPPEPGEAA